MAKEIGLFDIINDLSNSKKRISVSESGEMERAFNQWMILEALSHFPDLVFLMLEASKLKVSDQIMHEFLINAVPAKKRFSKWYKPDKILKEQIENVARFFGWSDSEAEKNLCMFSDEDLAFIHSAYNEETYKPIKSKKKKVK